MNENKARNSKQLKWAIPVGLGLVLVLGVGLLYRFTHPPLPPDIVQQAHSYGLAPQELYDARRLDQKLFAKKLSPAEWQRYVDYANQNSALRHMVARHLSATQGTPYEAQARKLMAQFLEDKDPLTRAAALISLRNFHDPSWRNVAQRFLADPNPFVHDMAASLLQEDQHEQMHTR
jgi:hypothetical protein